MRGWPGGGESGNIGVAWRMAAGQAQMNQRERGLSGRRAAPDRGCVRRHELAENGRVQGQLPECMGVAP